MVTVCVKLEMRIEKHYLQHQTTAKRWQTSVLTSVCWCSLPRRRTTSLDFLPQKDLIKLHAMPTPTIAPTALAMVSSLMPLPSLSPFDPPLAAGPDILPLQLALQGQYSTQTTLWGYTSFKEKLHTSIEISPSSKQTIKRVQKPHLWLNHCAHLTSSEKGFRV